MDIKRFTYKCGALLLSATIAFSSCTEEDETIDFSIPNNNILSGNIVKDMTLDTDTFYLYEKTYVNSGTTLTINAGAVVKGVYTKRKKNIAELIVEKGGKLVINGTASNPVIFTCDTTKAGSWNGIVINGNAPVNNPDANTYGGDQSDDNSGSIKYLRIEYAGKNSSAIKLNGVGSKTIIENVEIYNSLNNGFTFNGGTVNAKYLVCNGVELSSFNWNQGWVGKGQFWVSKSITDESYKKKIDARLIGESGLNENKEALMPISSPTLSNITIIGNEQSLNLVLFNSATQGKIYNVLLIDNPKAGIKAKESIVASNINNELLEFDYVSFQNVKKWGSYSANIDADKKFDKSDNYIEEAITLTDVFVGTTENGKNMSTDDTWFESTNYKGAVSSDNNWTEGWTK